MPGDGYQEANARGRVYSTDTPPQSGDQQPIQVADLRGCIFSLAVAVAVCTGHPTRPIQITPPAAPSVQIIRKPEK